MATTVGSQPWVMTTFLGGLLPGGTEFSLMAPFFANSGVFAEPICPEQPFHKLSSRL